MNRSTPSLTKSRTLALLRDGRFVRLAFPIRDTPFLTDKGFAPPSSGGQCCASCRDGVSCSQIPGPHTTTAFIGSRESEEREAAAPTSCTTCRGHFPREGTQISRGVSVSHPWILQKPWTALPAAGAYQCCSPRGSRVLLRPQGQPKANPPTDVTQQIQYTQDSLEGHRSSGRKRD